MSVLDELVTTARQRVRRDAHRRSLADLRQAAMRLPAARRFEAALRYGDRLGVVAEIKRASPSGGRFAAVAEGTRAVADLSRAYAAAGARCLSVLTEPSRFGGSDVDLAAASAAGLPVLRKDFTIDPYQVWQARALGADAVLLIARCLPGATLPGLLRVASEAGLDALVEIHDEAELERALAADATLIGVNARDLSDLQVDAERAARLLQVATGSGATLIAESGLASAADLERVVRAGAHGALIGTALLREPDPAASAARLTAAAPSRQPPASPPPHPRRTQVKACGLRTPDGIAAAVKADADLAGMVVAPGARRAVTPERAGELARGLSGGPRPVLVFRRPDRDEVERAVAAAGVASVQLPGFEAPPDWLPEVAPRLGELIGVIHRPASAREALCAAEAWYRSGATRVLVEGAAASQG
ncbi:MAG: hypothetical protein ACRDHD_09905, partial [Candidatus Limnocylindria bacterium]